MEKLYTPSRRTASYLIQYAVHKLKSFPVKVNMYVHSWRFFVCVLPAKIVGCASSKGVVKKSFLNTPV
jgi:hypothetical protein